MSLRILADLNVLISGQLITSRTETIEEYLKDRVKTLGVIGITSAFAGENVARGTLYEGGKEVKTFKLPGILIKRYHRFSQFLLIPVFMLYFLSIFWARFRFHKKFDLFIGVAFFSTFVGLFFKKMGIIKRLIYYSIDYYPPPARFGFNALLVKAFHFLDKVCVLNSDVVWHITPRIVEAREKFAKVSSTRYQHLVVPMCYGSRLMRYAPIRDIERYTIGYVGTISDNSGLQLLVSTLPKMIRIFPEVKIKIVGKGPFGNTLRRMIKARNLDSYFVFYGFIKDEEKVADIISHCAIGVAPWTSTSNDNSLYADPGKPKFYTFCGVPVVITRGPLVANEIEEKRVGFAIDYDENQLIEALSKFLGDEMLLKEYKENTITFSRSYTSEHVLDKTFKDTFSIFNKGIQSNDGE